MKTLFYYVFWSFGGLLSLFLLCIVPHQIKYWTRSADFEPSKWFSVLITVLLILLYCSTENLLMGVFGVSFLPLIWMVFEAWRQRRWREGILGDFQSFLLGLQGLLESGNTFHLSLYQLTENSTDRFTILIQSALKSFRNGDSLEILFRDLRIDPTGSLITTSLQLMESASRRGLGLGPFLQSLISIIDLEIQSKERIKSIQQSVRAQACLAALVPWCLGAVTALFQPEIVQNFLGTLEGKLILAVAITVEGVGLWAVKQAMRFY